ncbi:hypothetical protein JXA47_09140 [Candidatus Sumerlaeota bacterium]|nr:hypothetical protein [Candidatus Sumerlaeota bacterium]
MKPRSITAFALAMLVCSLAAQGPVVVDHGIATRGDTGIGWDQPLAGELASSDHVPMIMGHPQAGPDFFRDGFTFRGDQWTAVVIDLQCDFDGYLFLIDPQGNVAAFNDDFTSVNSSEISHTLTMTGVHRIIVSSYSPGVTGNYTLTLHSVPGVPQPVPSAQPSEVFDAQQRFAYEAPEPVRQRQGAFQEMSQGESIVDRLRPPAQSQPQQPSLPPQQPGFPVTNTPPNPQSGSQAGPSPQQQVDFRGMDTQWFEALGRQAELNRQAAERSGEIITRTDGSPPNQIDPNMPNQTAPQP